MNAAQNFYKLLSKSISEGSFFTSVINHPDIKLASARTTYLHPSMYDTENFEPNDEVILVRCVDPDKSISETAIRVRGLNRYNYTFADDYLWASPIGDKAVVAFNNSRVIQFEQK